MAADDGPVTNARPQRPPQSPVAASPTDALTAAFASAEEEFREHSEGNRKVMVAFSLGWQMAEVYRPGRPAGSNPASLEDLPGLSRLSSAELQDVGLLQVQAGITKLRDSICAAGLDVPNAERITPDEIVRSQSKRRPGPDEPSLVADTLGPDGSGAAVTSAAAPPEASAA
jgi:hypothetical protein